MNDVLLKYISAMYSHTRLQSQIHSASTVLLTTVLAKQRRYTCCSLQSSYLLLVT